MTADSGQIETSVARDQPGLSTRDRWWALGICLAALVLYVATLAPTVATVFDDSLEFQVVLPTLGIAHPTGYPLYTILGWIFSLLPVNDPAYRVNFFSAVAAAITVGLIFLVARRLGSSRLPAASASIIYGLSPVWWSQATIAEVYALHGMFVALILLLALQGNGTRKPWLALVFGLSLAHHRMTLLLLPGLLVYLLWTDPGVLRDPRRLLMLVGAGLLPLLLYAYLPIRGLSTTSLDGSYSNTWQGFWRHVLASDYGSFLSGNPLSVERSPAYPLRLLIEQIGIAAFLFGLVGWLRWPRFPRQWTFLALVFLANFLFAAFYNTSDVDVFFLPAIMVWLLMTAAGLTMLFEGLEKDLARRTLPGSTAIWLVLLQLLVVIVVLWHPLANALQTLRTEPKAVTCSEVLVVGGAPALHPNRAGDWSAHNCGSAMLAAASRDDATIIGLLGETTLLQYLQMAEDMRPEVALVTADAETERLAAVHRELAAGRTVYLTRELPGILQDHSLSAAGPLIRVRAVEELVSTTLPPVDASFGDSLSLVGFEFSPLPARNTDWRRVQLAWQVNTPIGEELKVSVRLMDPDGAVVQSQDAIPVHWAYPTTAWRAGETIIDSYDFALDPNTSLDNLTPLVILYRASDGSEVGRYPPVK
ncbi:MAG: DUF2723 domain-containing protein [Chloroflexota bacterium]|nr:DUF2723 domain-containing protein [Chloroflexota bacterium]